MTLIKPLGSLVYAKPNPGRFADLVLMIIHNPTAILSVGLTYFPRSLLLTVSQVKMMKHRNVFPLWILLFIPTTGGAMKFNLFSES